MDEEEELIHEYLSPRRLKEIAGTNDLESVSTLVLKVDTRDVSLGNFGVFLPTLEVLKLNDSHIADLRDLGSSLEHLKVLNMNNCKTENIEGIHTMSNLRELYLAYNYLEDVTPCSMLDQLELLDLEGNLLPDAMQLEFLSLHASLRNLVVRGNPLCSNVPSRNDYLLKLKEILPQLSSIDDIPIDQIGQSGISVGSGDALLIEEEEEIDYDTELQEHRIYVMQEANNLESENSFLPGAGDGSAAPEVDEYDDQVESPASSALAESPDQILVFDEAVSRQSTQLSSASRSSPLSRSRSPDSAISSSTSALSMRRIHLNMSRASSQRPRTAASILTRPTSAAASSFPASGSCSTAQHRPKTSLNRRSFSRPVTEDEMEQQCDNLDKMAIGSDLTSGITVCGPPSRALRHRRVFRPDSAASTDTSCSVDSTLTSEASHDSIVPRPPSTRKPSRRSPNGDSAPGATTTGTFRTKHPLSRTIDVAADLEVEQR